MPWSASDHQQRNVWGYVRSGTECTSQGNDFELIPTIKMETRHPVEIYFGRQFPRSIIIAEFWRPEVARIRTFSRHFCVFLEKRPLMIKFSKFGSESLHRDTDRRCHVQNSRKLSNEKSVKSCVVYLTQKKTKFQTVATARISPKLCHGQSPTFGWQLSKFHPNRFTFGGVQIIAGRVKAVKMHLKVLPILGEVIASRWVITAAYLWWHSIEQSCFNFIAFYWFLEVYWRF